jgi:hypothetical protein
MSEMTDATPATAPVPRCHACGAVRPPTAQWCLQCYTAFDPPQPALGPQQPRRATGPGDDGGAADAGADVATAPDDVVPPDDAAPLEGEAPPPDREELELRAEQMLQRLSQEESASPVGRWSDLSSGRGRKIAVSVGGALVLMLVLVAVMAGVGALL